MVNGAAFAVQEQTVWEIIAMVEERLHRKEQPKIFDTRSVIGLKCSFS
jgi:hypothetical protein